MPNTNKKLLREKLLMERAALSPEVRRTRSLAAQQRVLALEHWRQASCVLLYMDFQQETETGLLLADSLRQGKLTLLPRCIRISNTLELYAVTDPDQLVPGAYGIREPDPSRCTQHPEQVPEIVLLPGVAYDIRGFRLGYGGGYYDRLLDSGRFEDSLRIGLGFDFQLLDALPTEPWDVPVHAICTEERFLWI